MVKLNSHLTHGSGLPPGWFRKKDYTWRGFQSVVALHLVIKNPEKEVFETLPSGLNMRGIVCCKVEMKKPHRHQQRQDVERRRVSLAPCTVTVFLLAIWEKTKHTTLRKKNKD